MLQYRKRTRKLSAPTSAGTATIRKTKRVNRRGQVSAVKKQAREGKIKPGFVLKLGTHKQTSVPTPRDKKLDSKLKAMRPGYRVSKSGNVYFEARQNRSDTPKERGEINRKTRTYRYSKRLPIAKIHDKYAPKPILRQPKYKKLDNYLTQIVLGHWFDAVGIEYQLMKLKCEDGECDSNWHIWSSVMPTRSTQNIREKQDWVYFGNCNTTSFEKAIKMFETEHNLITDSSTYMGAKEYEGSRYFRMTAGLYNYLHKYYSGIMNKELSISECSRLCAKYERIFHALPYETMLCFNKYGDLLYQAVGIEHSCRSPLCVLELTQIVTHNHPSTKNKIQTTFSDPDITTFVHQNLTMMRAVGYNKTFCQIIKPISQTTYESIIKIINENHSSDFDKTYSSEDIAKFIADKTIQYRFSVFQMEAVTKELLKLMPNNYKVGKI